MYDVQPPAEASSNTAVLAGAAVGAIIIVLIILVLALFIIRKKKSHPHRHDNGVARKPDGTELISSAPPTVVVLDGKPNNHVNSGKLLY